MVSERIFAFENLDVYFENLDVYKVARLLVRDIY